jgi:hypothetical protein
LAAGLAWLYNFDENNKNLSKNIKKVLTKDNGSIIMCLTINDKYLIFAFIFLQESN